MQINSEESKTKLRKKQIDSSDQSMNVSMATASIKQEQDMDIGVSKFEDIDCERTPERNEDTTGVETDQGKNETTQGSVSKGDIEMLENKIQVLNNQITKIKTKHLQVVSDTSEARNSMALGAMSHNNDTNM